MSYTARAVTASSAPWPLQIGTHTHWARPLSAALVLRVLPRMVQPEHQRETADDALRAAFPKPRCFWRDPLWQLGRLAHGDAFRARVLQQVFAVPGIEPDAETDPEAALIAAHRRLAHPTAANTGPTLAIAALTCQKHLGATWYWNPARWPTVDGYAPLAAVWTEYVGLQALLAQHRMHMAEAILLTKSADKRAVRRWDALQKAAYPADPTVRGAA